MFIFLLRVSVRLGAALIIAGLGLCVLVVAGHLVAVTQGSAGLVSLQPPISFLFVAGAWMLLAGLSSALSSLGFAELAARFGEI